MDSVINRNLADFFATQPIEKAWVFGSYSRGEEKPESDIDILVRFLKGTKVTFFGYIRLMNKLEQLLQRKVDLVEESQLKDFARDSAEHDKILIYEREN